MKQPRGMTTCIFHVDELTDSTEDVILEVDDIKVSVVKYVKREDNLYVALEPGERFLIESNSSEGKSVQTLDFQRTHNGVVSCPYGIIDAALAAILKFRLERKRDQKDTPELDRMVYNDWIETLSSIIND